MKRTITCTLHNAQKQHFALFTVTESVMLLELTPSVEDQTDKWQLPPTPAAGSNQHPRKWSGSSVFHKCSVRTAL